MNSFIATLVARWARLRFVISVFYSAVCVLFMVSGWGGAAVAEYITGTIALLDDRLNLAMAQSPLLVWVLVATTLLVVAGQAFATREVIGLHREVTARRFDERLTELVRRSSDMIAI